MYLSDESNVQKALDMLELSLDELEIIVGRFSKISHRAGQLRGEVLEIHNGLIIRHHFTKKVLWKKQTTSE